MDSARERRRLIGQQLSAADTDEDTLMVLNASAHDVASGAATNQGTVTSD